MSGVSKEEKKKLLQLKTLFGENIFNKNSDLYITGPDDVYLFGPENGKILEGDSYQLETIVFSKTQGRITYQVLDVSDKITVNTNGWLSTKENYDRIDTVSVETAASFIYEDESGKMSDKISVTVEDIKYPDRVDVKGPAMINDDSEVEYEIIIPETNAINRYRVEAWVDGDIRNYVEYKRSGNKIIVKKIKDPEALARGYIAVRMTRTSNGEHFNESTFKISILNSNVLMSVDTNPEVLKVLRANCPNLVPNENYILKEEAAKFTASDLLIESEGSTKSIFSKNTITSFDEFSYFTGISEIPEFCFNGCTNLKSITLPETIRKIKMRAFQNTGLETITIPENTTEIDKTAFIYSSNLRILVVKFGNPKY